MELHNGDCLEVLKTLPDKSVDLIFTSPPYADLKTYIDFKGIPADKYVDWFFPIVQEIFRVLKPTGSFILNINDKVEKRFRHLYVYDLISKIGKETEFKLFERLFWNKMKGLPLQKRFGDRVEYVFWFVKSKDFTFHIDEMRTPYKESSVGRMKHQIKKRFVRTDKEVEEKKDWSPNEKGAMPTTLINISSETKRIAKSHIAVFPEKFAEYFIKGSTNENDVVLDPFMGTGTTAVVCKKLNRRCIGIEAQAEYCDVIRERIFKSI